MAGIELDGVNQKVVLDADGDTYTITTLPVLSLHW